MKTNDKSKDSYEDALKMLPCDCRPETPVLFMKGGIHRGEQMYTLANKDKILRWHEADKAEAIHQAKADFLRKILPERQSNELITVNLQQGKPQLAASRNGYNAAINDITTNAKREGIEL